MNPLKTLARFDRWWLLQVDRLLTLALAFVTRVTASIERSSRFIRFKVWADKWFTRAVDAAFDRIDPIVNRAEARRKARESRKRRKHA